MAFTLYVIPYALAAVLLLLLIPLALRRRLAVGSRTFALLTIASAIWCVGNAFEVAAVSLAAKRILVNLQYVAIMWVPTLWLLFVLEYTGRVRRVRARWIALLCLVPAITWVLLWVGGHHLMRYNEYLTRGSPFMVVSYGPWFFVTVVYNYLQLGAGAGVLVVSMARGNRFYRAQGQLLLLSCALILSANVVHVLKLGPEPLFDLTAPMFGVAVALVWVAIYRFRMLDLVPAAREAVIETMPDALLVIDYAGRVIDANPAAAKLFDTGGRSLVGEVAETLLPPNHRSLLAQAPADALQCVLEMPDPSRLVELRLTPLRDDAIVSGWLAVFHDVTERETLVRQLQAALADVHALSGLIPICAACKKVRTDDGYWQQVEAYVSARSQAEFTHSICPECVARLYPETPSGDRAAG